jgi:hypothetical protein
LGKEKTLWFWDSRGKNQKQQQHCSSHHYQTPDDRLKEKVSITLLTIILFIKDFADIMSRHSCIIIPYLFSVEKLHLSASVSPYI